MVYANAIKINDFSIINNQSGLYKGNTAKLKKIKKFEAYSPDTGNSNTDKKYVLRTIYNELSANRPVVLQVNGNLEGTSRHYVVVIGIKLSFDLSNLKETDFLILDVYDGKIETLTGKGKKNNLGTSSRFMIKGTDTSSWINYRSQLHNYEYQIYKMVL